MLVERSVTFSQHERSQPAWERHIVSTYSDGQIVEQKDLRTFTFRKKIAGGEPTDVCNCDYQTAWFDGNMWQLTCRKRQHLTPIEFKSLLVQTKQEFADHVHGEAIDDYVGKDEEIFWGPNKSIKVFTMSEWRFAILAQDLPLVFYVRPKPKPKQSWRWWF